MKFFNFGDTALVPLGDIRCLSKFLKPAEIGRLNRQYGIKLTISSEERFMLCWDSETERDKWWERLERELKALCTDFDEVRKDLQRIVQETDNES